MHADLNGKTAFVTGGAVGIGRGIALALAEAGERQQRDGHGETVLLCRTTFSASTKRVAAPRSHIGQQRMEPTHAAFCRARQELIRELLPNERI